MDNVTKLFLAGIISVICFSFTLAVFADTPVSWVIYMYFEKDGQHYDQKVNFEVSCYGYRFEPGINPNKIQESYEPERVFSFQGTCPKYGCKVYQASSLNYVHIDYCNLEGKIGTDTFIIEDYKNTPFGDCGQADEEEKDGFGLPVMTKCELKLTIPSGKDIPDPFTPEPDPKPKRGFWRSIWCFFKGLFGKGCN